MMSRDSRELDLVAELRLRQWARRNYVPAEQRSDSDWHAVVISEMRRIDREIGRAERVQKIVTSAGIVPLERSQHQTIRIDEPHAGGSSPKMHFTTSADSQVETFTPQYV